MKYILKLYGDNGLISSSESNSLLDIGKSAIEAERNNDCNKYVIVIDNEEELSLERDSDGNWI